MSSDPGPSTAAKPGRVSHVTRDPSPIRGSTMMSEACSSRVVPIIIAGGADVEHPRVPRPGIAVAAPPVEVQEAQAAEAVVEGDYDHVPSPVQPGAVIDRLAAGTDHERAPVEPHHDRPAAGVDGGRPHVQDEAVLAHFLLI